MSERPRRRWRRWALAIAAALLLAALLLDGLTRGHPLPELSALGARAYIGAPPPTPIFEVPVRDQRNRPLGIVARPGQGRWVLSIIFPDEDHPLFLVDRAYDAARLFALYRRVADVEDIVYEYEGERLAALSFPRTYAGDQAYDVWTAEHRSARLPVSAFTLINGRPKIAIATWNHLFAAAAPPSAGATELLADLPLTYGDRDGVEAAFREAFWRRWLGD